MARERIDRESWRRRALECRRLARAMHQEDVVRMLLDLAEELETRARQREAA
jgi:hypothetical protein